MSTDMSEVGSHSSLLFNILHHFTFPGVPFILIETFTIIAMWTHSLNRQNFHQVKTPQYTVWMIATFEIFVVRVSFAPLTYLFLKFVIKVNNYLLGIVDFK